MDLTSYFNSLPKIDLLYNKYATFSHFNGNPYRLITGYEVFKNSELDPFMRQFVVDQGKCIVMPNMLNSEVIGFVVRSISQKQFRNYTKCNHIPYGAGVNNKQFYQPWIIVESALDSDFLRTFYPFVIAINSVSVSANYLNFIKGTCSTCYCAFDNDDAGENAFRNLCYKHSGKDFHIKRLRPPISLDGKPLKDFGEILDCLHNCNIEDYNYYTSLIKCLMLNI